MAGDQSVKPVPPSTGADPSNMTFAFNPFDPTKLFRPASQSINLVEQQINERLGPRLAQKAIATQPRHQQLHQNVLESNQIRVQHVPTDAEQPPPAATRAPVLPAATALHFESSAELLKEPAPLPPAAAGDQSRPGTALYIESPGAEAQNKGKSHRPLSTKAIESTTAQHRPSSVPSKPSEGVPFPSDGTITINILQEASKIKDMVAPISTVDQYTELEAILGAATGAPPAPKTKPAAAPSRKGLPKKSHKATPGAISGQFTSLYRGVTRHRTTGRYEAHFWDPSFKREPKFNASGRQVGRVKGRQVYVGGFLNEIDAARAYDKAAIAHLGPLATTNFHVSEYEDFIAELQTSGKDPEAVVADIRRGTISSLPRTRKNNPFRGVVKQQYTSKWEASIDRAKGTQTLHLGVFNTTEAAAVAYDKAILKLKGTTSVTNYALSNYTEHLMNLGSYDVEGEAKKNGGGYVSADPVAEEKVELSRQYNFAPAPPKRLARGRKNKREEIESEEEEEDDVAVEYSSEKEEGKEGDEEKFGAGDGDGDDQQQQQPRSGRASQQNARTSSGRRKYKTKITGFIDSSLLEDMDATMATTTTAAPTKKNKPVRHGYNSGSTTAAAVHRQQINQQFIYPPTQPHQMQQQHQQQMPWWQQQQQQGLQQQPQPQHGSGYPYNMNAHPHPHLHPSAPQYNPQMPYVSAPGPLQPPHPPSLGAPLQPPSSGAWWQTNSMINPDVWMQWNQLMQGQHPSQSKNPHASFPGQHQNPPYHLRQRQQQYIGGGSGAPPPPPLSSGPPVTSQYYNHYQHHPMQMQQMLHNMATLQQQQQQHNQQQQQQRGVSIEELDEDSANEEGELDEAGANPPKKQRQNTTPVHTTRPTNLNISIPPFTSPAGGGGNGNSGGRQGTVLSPLAASLLSPLGLHADGKWKDSPLEKLFNAQDESLLKLLNSRRNNYDAAAGAAGGGGGGRDVAASPAGLKEGGSNGQEDIWGTLNWLESLDMKQLAAGAARRGTPPQGNRPGGGGSGDGNGGGGGAGGGGGVQQPQNNRN